MIPHRPSRREDLTWKNCTSATPCRVCGAVKWCSVSECETAWLCRHVNDGTAIARTGKDGQEYFIYFFSERPHGAESSKPAPKHKSETPQAPPPILDRVYRAFLRGLTLSTAHRTDLLDRGVTSANIERFGFRSYPDKTTLRSVLGAMQAELGHYPFQVPGFFEGRRGQLDVMGSLGGWILPYRNEEGLVVALRLRKDRGSSGDRYLWFSSKAKGGAGATNRPFLVEVATKDTVILTEGEVKAIILSQHLGFSAISFPGATEWRLTLPMLESLGVRRVILAFDADRATNKAVGRAFCQAVRHFRSANLTVESLHWGEVA